MNIIEHRKIYYAISGTIIVASIISVALWQFRLGIDFAGGTLWEVDIEGEGAPDALKTLLGEFGIEEPNIQQSGGSVFVVRFQEIDEATHQKLLERARTKWSTFEERRFETVGPTIGKTLKRKASASIISVLFVIAIYVAWSFRKVSRPISSWKYGAITILTLFHDVAAPIGLFAVLGHFGSVEIDSNFIVALLVVMGFSVHDTIVVFDRIRENLYKAAKKEEFQTIVNQSVRETFMRSVNTSLTVILVLAALFVWGSVTLRYFVLALMTGILVGTYSSIFIASPLLVEWAMWEQRRRGNSASRFRYDRI